MVSVQTAFVLGVILEALLSGVAYTLYGWTLDRVMRVRSQRRSIVVAATLLIIVGTMHMVLMWKYLLDGVASELPLNVACQVYNFEFKASLVLYAVQTWIGDLLLLYRCYVVWQSIRPVLLPALLWLSCFVVGITDAGFGWSSNVADAAFSTRSAAFTMAFYATTTALNLTSTLLLAYRIWSMARPTPYTRSQRIRRHVYPIIVVILDSGAMYTVMLIGATIALAQKSYSVFTIMFVVTQVIPIACLVIMLRITIAKERMAGTTVSETAEKSQFPLTDPTPLTAIQFATAPTSDTIPPSDRHPAATV